MSHHLRWVLAAMILAASDAASAQSEPPSGKDGLVELGKADSRLKGHYAVKGLKVQIVASEPAIVDPTAMAFDDQGNLYVAEWKSSDHMFDTWDTLALPEGGTTRVRRRRKGTTDVIKRLKDIDGDGVYESSEVVVDGAEMPASIFPWKNSLYLTCVGRLEKWSDEDGDGKFETKSVLADGFCGFYHHWLSGMTLGADGWLYLTAGDNDNHVVGSDGSRVELSRTGGVFRCKVDGSRMKLFALGFRNPYRDIGFDSSFAPFLADNDQEDGSKFQGVRLIAPVEEGDYGWRLRPGAPCCAADFDRGAVDGERPGKLPILGKTGRGAPAGVVVYNGMSLPTTYRDMILYPDVFQKSVRGYKAEPKGGSHALKSVMTLMTADDDYFRPCQAVVGPDGAVYVLDWRSNSGGAGRLWGDGKFGRLYKLTWEGDGVTPSLATKPNNWKRIFDATNDQLLYQWMQSFDYPEAARAQRELIDRAIDAKGTVLNYVRFTFLTYAANPNAPIHARLLGLQGARQLWNEQVEMVMVNILADPSPEIRRLAAQALSWEPKTTAPKLVAKLLERLDDPDGRVVREAALAAARHAEARPQQPAAVVFRWLLAHPSADPAVRDGLLRSLERMGETGVEEIALAVRTRKGVERESAVALFTGLRSAQAAEALTSLAKIPDLTGPERLALVRQFQDIPLDIPVSTTALADFVARHPDLDPSTKVATLDACRLSGNPASSLVLALLEDDDESVRMAATTLAAQSRPPGSMAKLADRLKDPARSSPERLSIIQALAHAGPSVFSTLDAAYLAAEEPALRLASLRSMAEADRVKATPALEAALAAPDPMIRAEAVRLLGELPQSSLILGRAFLSKTLGRTDLPTILAALRKYDSPEHRKLVDQIEREAMTGVAAINPTEIKNLALNQGDPWAGLGIFFRANSARCSSCHKVEGYGQAVGPSLAGTSEALSADKLIDSILNPSREIKEGYESIRLGLKDGRVISGILSGKDARSLTLREVNGREIRVPRDEVDEELKEHVSLMPAGLALELSPKELADLVAFLMSKPAQAALKHGPRRVDHALAIGPFAMGADKLRLPLDKLEAAKVYSGQDGASVGWSVVDASTSGVLNLRGQFGTKPGRVYLAVSIRSPRDQGGALRFAVEGSARTYLNGTKVAETDGRNSANLTSAFARVNPGDLAPMPELAWLPLKSGANLLIVALDHSGTGDARIALEVASPDPVEYKVTGN